jgi:hypothetical protein
MPRQARRHDPRALGLLLDIWAYHTQLGEVYALARATLGRRVIVDHLGDPVGTGPHAVELTATAVLLSREKKSLWRVRLPCLRLTKNLIGNKREAVTSHSFAGTNGRSDSGSPRKPSNYQDHRCALCCVKA